MFHRFNRAKIENRKRKIFEQREDNKIEETCDTIIDPVREKSSIESRGWAKGSWKRTIWGINRGEGGRKVVGKFGIDHLNPLPSPLVYTYG